MSDYEDEDFESLEEYQEQEEDGFKGEDEDWSDSLDDMESDAWSAQFGRGEMDLEELDAEDDFGDEEVDDSDLEKIERNYFAEEEGREERLVDRYVELKDRLRTIQQELKELKPKVVAAIADAGGVGREKGGIVKVTKRPKWKYSDDVARLEEELREKKKQEREAGLAEVNNEIAYLLIQQRGGQSGT